MLDEMKWTNCLLAKQESYRTRQAPLIILSSKHWSYCPYLFYAFMSMLFLMNIIIHQERVDYSNTQIWRSFKDWKLVSHVTLLSIYKILAKLLIKTIQVFSPCIIKLYQMCFVIRRCIWVNLGMVNGK
jgi:hypothetical protein